MHDISHTEFGKAEGRVSMDWNDIHVSDDSEYKTSEDEGPPQKPTPGINSSGKNLPTWAAKMLKSHLSHPQNLGPQNRKKQKLEKKVEIQGKGENEIWLDIPLNVDPNKIKCD